MVVEDFLFAKSRKWCRAGEKREAEAKYVKEKAQMDDPEMVLRIYNKTCSGCLILVPGYSCI